MTLPLVLVRHEVDKLEQEIAAGEFSDFEQSHSLAVRTLAILKALVVALEYGAGNRVPYNDWLAMNGLEK